MNTRELIHRISHATWVICFKTKNRIFTGILHLKLYINNVNKGINIKAVNGAPSFHIHSKAKEVRLGNNVLFREQIGSSWFAKNDITVKQNATLIIGDNSGISGCMLYSTNRVEIGKNVMIGGGCRIFDTNFHPIEAELRRKPATCNNGATAPVIIEDDVFIGTNCIIGKGIHIGKGAVIAAGSVVVKNIPENEIWGGNPAKFLKKIEQ